MGAPEQPHLPGMEDEPVEPTVTAPPVPADDAAVPVVDDAVDAAEEADVPAAGVEEPDAAGSDAAGSDSAGADDGSADDEAAEEAAEPEGVEPDGTESEAEAAAAAPDDEEPDEADAQPEVAEATDGGTAEEEHADEPVDAAPAGPPEADAETDDGPVEEVGTVDGPADGPAGEPVVEPVVEPLADAAFPDEPVADEPEVDRADAPAAPEPDTDEIPLAAARVPLSPEPVDGPEPAAGPVTEPVPDVVASPVAAPAAARPAPAPLHRPRERARTRLLEAMKPKLNRGQLLAALLCAGLGFGLVTQIQSTQSEQLDALTQADLVRLLQEVNTEADRLSAQEASARDERERLAASETGDLEAEALTSKRLQALGVLAGTLPATGPGIRLTLTDPKGEVDAATLFDTLQELRDAGAEAVQINDVRVVASTSFQDLDGAVKVGGTPVRPPYVYLVIGDAETLDAAMRIPGGVLDVVEQKGGQGSVSRQARVDVTALHRVLDPQYARPAPEASP